ncbi:MAG: GntR family transcriptional regulator [OCS116 cluster bacterium]|nr:GntR family transcriptional regulator [OCS116 cluster bacterium]
MENQVGNTHALRAVFDLRKKILSGELAAGVRLREVALAKELNISRTPVRDAMSRLAEEGLLERAKTGGFIIRRFGADDIADSIELRGVLEGTAARLAAERGVSKDKLVVVNKLLIELDDCFSEQGLKVDLPRYSELNADFHNELSKLCGSDIIQRELERVRQLPFASPSAFLEDKNNRNTFALSLLAAQEQHKEIIMAIEAREGSRAESVAREHAREARKNLESTLGQNPLAYGGVMKAG